MNILWIMTDQQRFDTLGCNGNAIIKTPNLDRLAAEGANFSHCFVQAPVCVPSRQTCFTGRYPHSHRNRVNYTPLDPSETLIQKHLQEAGYATGCVGKLHYYPPTRAFAESTGFDTVLLHDGAQCDAYSSYREWLEEQGHADADAYRRTDPDAGANPLTTAIPAELHETAWTGEQTRIMLKEMAAGDKPFFLFSSYWKPHASFEVPAPWSEMYSDIDIPLPDEMTMEEIQKLPEPVKAMVLRHDPPHYTIDRELLQWRYRSYYGAISQIDDEVGQTLALLDELGLRENTLVLFCSDHGDLIHEHGIQGKNVFFDAAERIPFILRHPDIAQGQYQQLIETTDFMSTIFELADIPVPVNNQGRSFQKLLSKDPEYIEREFVFAENVIPEVITHNQLDMPYEPGKGVGGIKHPDAKMVRSHDWKYNYYVGHKEELYHIAEDPGETVNRADDPACADVKARMKSALLDWLITADETDQIEERWGEV